LDVFLFAEYFLIRGVRHYVGKPPKASLRRAAEHDKCSGKPQYPLSLEEIQTHNFSFLKPAELFVELPKEVGECD